MCSAHSSFCIDLNLSGHDSAVHLQDVLMRYGWKHQRFTHNMSEIQRTRRDPDVQIHITEDSWTDPQRKHLLWASECLLMCWRHLKHWLIRRKPLNTGSLESSRRLQTVSLILIKERNATELDKPNRHHKKHFSSNI